MTHKLKEIDMPRRELTERRYIERGVEDVEKQPVENSLATARIDIDGKWLTVRVA